MQWGQKKETLLCVLKLVALTPLNFFTSLEQAECVNHGTCFLSIIYLKADFYCFSALLVFSCRVQLFVMLLSVLGSSLGSLRAILAIFTLSSAICSVLSG